MYSNIGDIDDKQIGSIINRTELNSRNNDLEDMFLATYEKACPLFKKTKFLGVILLISS